MGIIIRTRRDLINLCRNLGLQCTVTDAGKGHYRIRKWIDGKLISTGEALDLQSASDLAIEMFNQRPWNAEREDTFRRYGS